MDLRNTENNNIFYGNAVVFNSVWFIAKSCQIVIFAASTAGSDRLATFFAFILIYLNSNSRLALVYHNFCILLFIAVLFSFSFWLFVFCFAFHLDFICIFAVLSFILLLYLSFLVTSLLSIFCRFYYYHWSFPTPFLSSVCCLLYNLAQS